jgi:hypothetical protein
MRSLIGSSLPRLSGEVLTSMSVASDEDLFFILLGVLDEK